MPKEPSHEFAKLLTPAEVATAFRVDVKTVTRWARQGKLPFVWTLGGHRRYLETQIVAIAGRVQVEEPKS